MDSHTKHLYRSRKNRVFAGIAGGIGHYFNVDPTFIRLVLLILGFFMGPALLLLYVLTMLFIPKEPSGEAADSSDHEAKWLESRRGILRMVLVVLLIAIAFGFIVFGSLVAFYHPWGWQGWDSPRETRDKF